MENEDPKVIEKFDPHMQDLAIMVEETKNITATDLKDKAQLEIVRTNRIALKNARVKIEKTGKATREEAVKFQKDVIAYEKKLIAIIEPEELRLAAIEQEAERLAIREERMNKIPARLARIEDAGLNDFHKKTIEDLLQLDAEGFEGYMNSLDLAKKQAEIDERNRIAEAKEAELAAREKAVEDELKRIEREKEIAIVAEKVAIRAAQETEERIRCEAEEKAENEKRIAEKAEADRIAQEKAMKKNAEYQEFLKSIGMTKDNVSEFHKIDNGTEIVVYKKVGTYTK